MPALDPAQEAYVTLLRAAGALMHGPVALLKQHGLTPAQYNVLRILRGAGKDGLRCNEVGARMIQRESDITRLLDRLEKRGLTTRKRDRGDRRVVHVAVTPAGLELLAGLDQPIIEVHRAQFARLSPSRLEELVNTLNLLLPSDHQ
jgi:DNA-binding MarR family transcriptional regulator